MGGVGEGVMLIPNPQPVLIYLLGTGRLSLLSHRGKLHLYEDKDSSTTDCNGVCGREGRGGSGVCSNEGLVEASAADWIIE